MTAFELSADIFTSLSRLSDNEAYLKKAASYLKKLAAKKDASEDECAYVPRTKQEQIEELDHALKEVKLHLDGKIKLKTLDQAINEL